MADMLGVGIGAKPLFRECRQPLGITIHHTWLDLQHQCAALASFSSYKIEQDSQRWSVGVIQNGSTWRIKIGAMQASERRDQDQHSGTELSVIIHNAYMHRLSTKVGSKFAPFVRLCDVATA